MVKDNAEKTNWKSSQCIQLFLYTYEVAVCMNVSFYYICLLNTVLNREIFEQASFAFAFFPASAAKHSVSKLQKKKKN